jgi:ABC-type uncharacterized transport system fused permease/ATPase subunit
VSCIARARISFEKKVKEEAGGSLTVNWEKVKFWALAAFLAAVLSLTVTVTVFATSWAMESLRNFLATWDHRFLLELTAAVGAMILLGLLMFLVIDALALALAVVWP